MIAVNDNKMTITNPNTQVTLVIDKDKLFHDIKTNKNLMTNINFVDLIRSSVDDDLDLFIFCLETIHSRIAKSIQEEYVQQYLEDENVEFFVNFFERVVVNKHKRGELSDGAFDNILGYMKTITRGSIKYQDRIANFYDFERVESIKSNFFAYKLSQRYMQEIDKDPNYSKPIFNILSNHLNYIRDIILKKVENNTLTRKPEVRCRILDDLYDFTRFRVTIVGPNDLRIHEYNFHIECKDRVFVKSIKKIVVDYTNMIIDEIFNNREEA